MKRFTVAGLMMMAAFAGVVLAQDKLLKELEGSYKLTMLEKGGKPAPKDLTDSLTITIKGDTFNIKFGDEEKKAKIKVDESKTPATIDISPSDGPEKGMTFLGIVKSEKGEVTIAFTEKGDRPKDFKSEGETLLLKMKKDEKK
jgi:uncharacterized protein (TIGR03067 family)